MSEEEVQDQRPVHKQEMQLEHQPLLQNCTHTPTITDQVVPIGTFEWLIPQNRLLWPPELEALYGLPSAGRGETTLEEWSELLHPADQARVLAEISISINLDIDFQTEFRIVWPNHRIHYLTAKARVSRDAAGQPVRLLGVNVDITEYKQIETLITGQRRALELLAKDVPLSEILDALLHQVEESSTSGILTSILLLDADGVHLRHASAPSLPESYTKSIDGSPIGPHAGSCGTAAYWGKSVYVSDIASDPLWANYKHLALPYGLRACWSTPIRSSAGKVLGTFAMYYHKPHSPSVHDQRLIDLVTHITATTIERKQIEEQLKESEERFRSLSRSSPVGIFLTDTQGRTTYTNPRCQEICGFTLEESLEFGWRYFVHPDDLPALVAISTKALYEEAEYTQQCRFQHRDGSIRWTKIQSGPVFSDHREYVGRTGTVEDITELKISQQRKDEFISMASHELKTPVTSIKGFTQVLLRRFKQSDDQDSLRLLNIMNEQLNKLAKLITNLLDLSRMQTGKLSYHEELCDLDTLVEEVIKQFQPTISSHQLLLEGKTHTQIFGDKDRLGQVLINLLANAIKYSPHANTVIIRLSTDQDHALVDVQDFGLGISQAHHEKIFEQFYQVTDPMEKTFPGLGIGLYISREIIKRHHGQLWVKSRKGQGSTFSFRIPFAKHIAADDINS